MITPVAHARAGNRSSVRRAWHRGRVDFSSPTLDATRGRLLARFGARVEPWWERLPGAIADLAERWELVVGDAVGRGNTSLVVRCRRADGRRAVLKLTPDAELGGAEASALRRGEYRSCGVMTQRRARCCWRPSRARPRSRSGARLLSWTKSQTSSAGCIVAAHQPLPTASCRSRRGSTSSSSTGLTDTAGVARR